MENQPQENQPIQSQPPENLPLGRSKPDKKIVIGGIVVAILALAAIGAAGYFWWQNSESLNQKACTMEAKLCPDGSYVGRTVPNCEFAACPNVNCAAEGKLCAGIAGIQCCSGLTCQMEGNYPDASGTCVNEQIKDWQTYRNEEYGFEVKYPGGTIFEIQPETDSRLSIYSDLFSLIIDKNSTNLDLKNWYDKEHEGGIGTSYDGAFNKEERNINGSQAIILSQDAEGTYEESVLLKNTRNTIVYFQTSQFGEVGDIYSANRIDQKKINESIARNRASDSYRLFNQILTTFKFIEPIDTSSWQTYRNEKRELEFKHPADWVIRKNTGENWDISWDGKLNEISYILDLSYISQDTLNLMGVNYCVAYPEDNRCENFKWDNLSAMVVWDIETEGAFTASSAEIGHPNGGIIVISIYHRPNQDIKIFFRQILATFKFIK